MNGGRFDFDDGGTYCGGWEDGKAHGHGVCTGPKGQGEYSGAWHYGFEVSGVYTWPSGNTYEGQWQNGKRHGLGVELRGRWIYRGEWTQGYKGRYGVRQSTSSQSKYEGTWANGLQDGYGVEVYADGGTYHGQWLRGMRHGYGIRKSAPYGVAAKYRSRSHAYASLTSLRSDQGEENADKDKKNDDNRGGFVLRARSEPPSRRRSLSERSMAVRRTILQGLRIKKQRSTGEIDNRITTGCTGSIRSSGSTGSCASDESGATRHSGGHVDEFVDPNAVETYTGEWKNDKRSGYGISERSDGLKYEGEWFNNKKYGYGLTTLKDGSREEGKYKNNTLISSHRCKNMIFIRSSKLKERVEAAVQSAMRASQIALQKAEIAISRASTSNDRAGQSEIASLQAREDCELARMSANKFAPEFFQPGLAAKKQHTFDMGNHVGPTPPAFLATANLSTARDFLSQQQQGLKSAPPLRSMSTIIPQHHKTNFVGPGPPGGAAYDEGGAFPQPMTSSAAGGGGQSESAPSQSADSDAMSHMQMIADDLDNAAAAAKTSSQSARAFTSDRGGGDQTAPPGGGLSYVSAAAPASQSARYMPPQMHNYIGLLQQHNLPPKSYPAFGYAPPTTAATAAGALNRTLFNDELLNAMQMASQKQYLLYQQHLHQQRHQYFPQQHQLEPKFYSAQSSRRESGVFDGPPTMKPTTVPPSSSAAAAHHVTPRQQAPSSSRRGSPRISEVDDEFTIMAGMALSGGGGVDRRGRGAESPPLSRDSSRHSLNQIMNDYFEQYSSSKASTMMSTSLSSTLMQSRAARYHRRRSKQSATTAPPGGESSNADGSTSADEAPPSTSRVTRRSTLATPKEAAMATTSRDSPLHRRLGGALGASPLAGTLSGQSAAGTAAGEIKFVQQRVRPPTLKQFSIDDYLSGGDRNSLPDLMRFEQTLTASGRGLTREDVARLSSQRRQELQRLREEAELDRANPIRHLRYLYHPSVRAWLLRWKLPLLVLLINVCLSAIFYKLVTYTRTLDDDDDE